MNIKILKYILIIASIITIFVGYSAFKKHIPMYIAIICVFVYAILSLVYYLNTKKSM